MSSGGFLSLPFHIVEKIGCLTPLRDLAALCGVCRRAQALFDHKLYEIVILRHNHDIKSYKLAFDAKPERLGMVRDLIIHANSYDYPRVWNDSDIEMKTNVLEMVKQLVSLKRLFMNSFLYITRRELRDTLLSTNGGRLLMANLEKLCIHNAGGSWVEDTTVILDTALFPRLPSLRELTIHHNDLDAESDFYSRSGPRSYPYELDLPLDPLSPVISSSLTHLVLIDYRRFICGDKWSICKLLVSAPNVTHLTVSNLDYLVPQEDLEVTHKRLEYLAINIPVFSLSQVANFANFPHLRSVWLEIAGWYHPPLRLLDEEVEAGARALMEKLPKSLEVLAFGSTGLAWWYWKVCVKLLELKARSLEDEDVRMLDSEEEEEEGMLPRLQRFAFIALPEEHERFSDEISEACRHAGVQMEVRPTNNPPWTWWWDNHYKSNWQRRLSEEYSGGKLDGLWIERGAE